MAASRGKVLVVSARPLRVLGHDSCVRGTLVLAWRMAGAARQEARGTRRRGSCAVVLPKSPKPELPPRHETTAPNPRNPHGRTRARQEGLRPGWRDDMPLAAVTCRPAQRPARMVPVIPSAVRPCSVRSGLIEIEDV